MNSKKRKTWFYQSKYLYNRSPNRSSFKAGDIVRQDIDSKDWNQYSFSPQPAVVLKDQLPKCNNVDIQ